PPPAHTRSTRRPGTAHPPAEPASIAIARRTRLRFKPSAIVFDARARWNAEGGGEVVASLDARRRPVDNHAPLAVPTNVAGWSSLVARWAHNPKVGGSNPPPATNFLLETRYLPRGCRMQPRFSFPIVRVLSVFSSIACGGSSREPCTRRTTSPAISIRRVARLSRNVGQPDHILANPITSHKAERRPGSGEIWLAVTKHDGVQVDSILIDQAKFGEALRQVRASNFDLPVALGLQFADCALKITLKDR